MIDLHQFDRAQCVKMRRSAAIMPSNPWAAAGVVHEESRCRRSSLYAAVMRLSKLLPDGRRQIVGFALPGDFLGISVNGRHGISADAVGPVVVCRFVKKSFASFVEGRPNLLRRINEFVARDLTEAQEQ